MNKQIEAMNQQKEVMTKQVMEMGTQREETRNQHAFNKILDFISEIEGYKFEIDNIYDYFLTVSKNKNYKTVEQTKQLRKLTYIVLQFNRILDYIDNYKAVKRILYERVLMLYSVLFMYPLDQISHILDQYTTLEKDKQNELLSNKLIEMHNDLRKSFEEISEI